MPSAKLFTEDGLPYLDSVSNESTIAYGEFVSEVCMVFKDAFDLMQSSPQQNFISVLGAELLGKLHGPYAKALAYEYDLCQQGGAELAPGDGSEHITNTISGAFE